MANPKPKIDRLTSIWTNPLPPQSWSPLLPSLIALILSCSATAQTPPPNEPLTTPIIDRLEKAKILQDLTENIRGANSKPRVWNCFSQDSAPNGSAQPSGTLAVQVDRFGNHSLTILKGVVALNTATLSYNSSTSAFQSLRLVKLLQDEKPSFRLVSFTNSIGFILEKKPWYEFDGKYDLVQIDFQLSADSQNVSSVTFTKMIFENEKVQGVKPGSPQEKNVKQNTLLNAVSICQPAQLN